MFYFNLGKWKKINVDSVCFGARKNSYGTFRIKESGFIYTFRLRHKSGSVRCNPNYPSSYWGCTNTKAYKQKNLLTVITHTNKTALLLAEYEKRKKGTYKTGRYYSYQLDGVNVNSTELTFNKLPSPLPVFIDQEFQIWYGQDLVDWSESNNSGQTCVDVYAWYI